MDCPDHQSTPHNTPAPSAFSRFRPLSRLKNLCNRMAGAPVENGLDEYWEMVESVKAVDFSCKTALQLAERTRQLAHFIRAGRTEQDADHVTGLAPPDFCDDATTPSREGTHALRDFTEQGSEILSPELLIETFALVREASRRTLRLDPFDVQLIAGMAMARGCIAELPTGEGKTLAAVFTALLLSLSGRGVHILTFNDYLARRDAAWMDPIYRILGLSVGCVQEGMSLPEKRDAYGCDITYAAAKESGFDFLRDQTAYDRGSLVHRPFHFALVDEADSILIDEARIPLVISGADDRASWDTHRLTSIVRALIPSRDFETDGEHRNVFLTDGGIERIESMLGSGSLYSSGNRSLLEAIYCALHAQALLRRDVDYIVRRGRIEIVDEYTGRVVDKRHWPDGLQAAVEAKEGLSRKTQGRILGSITLQHFFRLYPAFSGMTATAQSAADEIYEFYGVKTVVIPPHTPTIRVDHPDVVFTHRDAKRRAIVREIIAEHAIGRPILVGTASIKESEELAGDLRSAGITCVILNAKNDEVEASIIAKAGMPGAVTISTNMAGRGVDIKLRGNDEGQRHAVVTTGGLYVIGTNRHESLRIDRQLRGRAGRQGDPGATRFFISLEDDLFERYGLTQTLMARHRLSPQEGALPDGSIRHQIVHAQRIIEGQNFDIRRSLYKFSSIVDLQRQIVQDRRERTLLGLDEPETGSESSRQSGWILPGHLSSSANCKDSSEPGEAVDVQATFSVSEPALSEEGVRRFGPDKMAELERRATLFHLDRLWSDHLAWIQDTRDSIHLVHLGAREPIDEFLKWAAAEFVNMQREIDGAVISEMTTIVQQGGPVDLDLERLKGPSSTWTYLLDENQFGWGIEMVKAKNSGFLYAFYNDPLFTGPLFILTLVLKALSHRKRKSRHAAIP